MKRYVIIIPFHNPWDWHTDYTNQTAQILSQNHTVLCFLWGDTVSLYEVLSGRRSYRPVQRIGNLWKIQPLFVVPGKRFILPQILNIVINAIFLERMAKFLALFEKKHTLFWFFGYFDPVFFVLPAIFRHWRTIYDCVDIASSPQKKAALRIKRSELRLLTSAWLVVANSRVLTKRLKTWRKDIHTVPLGFRREMFANDGATYPLPRSRQPDILYIGSLDYRINWRLLELLVTKHRSYRFLLFGPVFHDHLSLSDIHRIGRVLNASNVIHDHVGTRKIPSLIRAADITIIPFDTRHDIARFSFPMKLMEYFYGQKPVVSTPIHELKQFRGLVRIGRTQNEWSKAIREILRHPLSAEEKKRERYIALQNTWLQKLDRIRELMDMYD